MEADAVMALFDSCWFNQEIFKKSSISASSSNLKKIPDQQIEGNLQKPEFSSKLSIQTRSKSDHLMSSKTSINSGSFSPDSVLSTPQLEAILSGAEEKAELQTTPQAKKVKNDDKKKKKRKKKAKIGLSKSLSELEFQELKGFMDLGFVFSEEDKNDSNLVEIIPGLQRFGKEKKDGEEERSIDSVLDKSSITRPYLSEAWDVLDRRKKENTLMNWRVPAVNNEIIMKDSLKWWAHIVASSVR